MACFGCTKRRCVSLCLKRGDQSTAVFFWVSWSSRCCVALAKSTERDGFPFSCVTHRDLWHSHTLTFICISVHVQGLPQPNRFLRSCLSSGKEKTRIQTCVFFLQQMAGSSSPNSADTLKRHATKKLPSIQAWAGGWCLSVSRR